MNLLCTKLYRTVALRGECGVPTAEIRLPSADFAKLEPEDLVWFESYLHVRVSVDSRLTEPEFVDTFPEEREQHEQRTQNPP